MRWESSTGAQPLRETRLDVKHVFDDFVAQIADRHCRARRVGCAPRRADVTDGGRRSVPPSSLPWQVRTKLDAILLAKEKRARRGAARAAARADDLRRDSRPYVLK